MEESHEKNIIIVAADVSPPCILEALADACYESGYPLIVATSYGLIGSVRLQLPAEGVILLQPKPTNFPPDLRKDGIESCKQLLRTNNVETNFRYVGLHFIRQDIQ